MSSGSAGFVPSPFLQPSRRALSSSLAILHLRRDQLTPVYLSKHDDENKGYKEGKVTNTRFGSFPHSTLIDLPWGSQVRASKVDTGSRGRKATGTKRKLEEGNADIDPISSDADALSIPKVAIVAQSGFAHLLPPTPESWTVSLPHRTQVVYTPDYSFILQRLMARPGTQIIEAGAGSGSFSHAAARAVYKGYPSVPGQSAGKVWSFEFHQERSEKLRKEITEHGLEGIVKVTHRDVYNDGFAVKNAEGDQLVQATAIFLDLPAPWLALPHLTRARKGQEIIAHPKAKPYDESNMDNVQQHASTSCDASTEGPLKETSPVHICCFLPCIEQVQKTVSALQSHSWQHISVTEVMAHRIEVRRERVGINEEGLRGVNSSPANVEEALLKLKEDENRTQVFHQISQKLLQGGAKVAVDRNGVKTKHERLREIQEASEQRKLYAEGKLVHRSEPELKTHTSYLIFAVLPREWHDADENNARKRHMSEDKPNDMRN